MKLSLASSLGLKRPLGYIRGVKPPDLEYKTTSPKGEKGHLLISKYNFHHI